MAPKVIKPSKPKHKPAARHNYPKYCEPGLQHSKSFQVSILIHFIERKLLQACAEIWMSDVGICWIKLLRSFFGIFESLFVYTRPRACAWARCYLRSGRVSVAHGAPLVAFYFGIPL